MKNVFRVIAQATLAIRTDGWMDGRRQRQYPFDQRAGGKNWTTIQVVHRWHQTTRRVTHLWNCQWTYDLMGMSPNDTYQITFRIEISKPHWWPVIKHWKRGKMTAVSKSILLYAVQEVLVNFTIVGSLVHVEKRLFSKWLVDHLFSGYPWIIWLLSIICSRGQDQQAINIAAMNRQRVYHQVLHNQKWSFHYRRKTSLSWYFSNTRNTSIKLYNSMREKRARPRVANFSILRSYSMIVSIKPILTSQFLSWFLYPILDYMYLAHIIHKKYIWNFYKRWRMSAERCMTKLA